MSQTMIGVGLGYRPEIARDILEHFEEIDTIEFLADSVFKDNKMLEEIRDLSGVFPVIPHGVNLSIGSVDCLEHTEYLDRVEHLCRSIQFPYYSDHMALTKVLGNDVGHLTPLWLTDEQLDVVVENVLAVQARIGLPLVLENITSDFEIPGAQMRPVEFLNRAVERTGCDVLLDLANLFISGTNMGFDPEEFLDALDLGAVRQIHLAGGIKFGPVWVDSHSAPIQNEVWTLFEQVAPRCDRLQTVIIERDSHFGDFDVLLDEVRRAQTLWPARRALRASA